MTVKKKTESSPVKVLFPKSVRAMFEKWCEEHGIDTSWEDGDYARVHVAMLWGAYRAGWESAQ
jgi:hypothetical protein